MVLIKEADLVLGPTTLDYVRSQAMDYSQPLFIDSHTILYRRPEVEPDLKGFIKPFALDNAKPKPVYNIDDYITNRIHTFQAIHQSFREHMKEYSQEMKKQQHKRAHKRELQIDLVTAKMHTISNKLSSTNYWPRATSSTTFITILWILVSFIIVTVYKSTLKAMLIIPKVTAPFRNVEELVSQDHVRYLLPRSSVIHQVTQSSDPNTIYGRLWSGHHELVRNRPGKIIGRIVFENRAMLAPSLYLKGLMQTAHNLGHVGCRLARAEEPFLHAFRVIGFPKGSELKYNVNSL
ncbi:uncharacterized protein LOC143019427 [Oratosquilla oratoria]|uniref:uncharacterized protein LOC143019427 n=1 Tax=Oratosquilla oratoria TaxID=337810 RepID=UPI003F76F267